MSIIHQRGPAKLHANLTPMIDVTFLLIVFFVLVSQIVEVENIEMSLPELEEPESQLPGEAQRVVINLIPARGGEPALYRLGSRAWPAGPEGASALADRLSQLLDANPALLINLRADRMMEYDLVQPVLESVAAAAAQSERGAKPRINLVVVREES